ncbi:MAG: hypothetical protein RBG1_1C00001G1393 [candidate division Zixibacteria bacterium RBG-1]|nr:MAG: hypothetical protein RBG1_1C00001G1393 [candidate division Zixibacteria bacterium RBG-1]OGC85550.1 MAG: hypothetical protein A2V73_06310 [candidate division Zixibacteria bacterium RBG_19FT_COMBO_42_43]
MPFTNIDLVKKHLVQHQIGVNKKEDVLVQLTGNSPVKLPDNNISANSEKIKGKEQIAPTLETVSFASGDTIQLLHSDLIPETVVVAKDSSLGQVYIEHADYHIDYDNGKITRITTGSITVGASVVIWYLYFRVYVKGTDYDFDYAKGEVARRTSGAIEDGQWIFVDYASELGFLNDDLISNAIVEANAKVFEIIDLVYQNSTDQGLISGETYLAVSILCNVKALESMTLNSPGTQAKALASSWSDLSSLYQKQAFEVLSKFAKAKSSLPTPTSVRSEK